MTQCFWHSSIFFVSLCCMRPLARAAAGHPRHARRTCRQSSRPARTDALLARFRRQRPLRGGSLLVTIFGRRDCAARRHHRTRQPDRARAAVRLDRAARAHRDRPAGERAMGRARSAAAAPATTASPPTAARASPKRRSASTARRRDSWNGQWTLVIFPPSLRGCATQLREELTWLGFGELTRGCSHTRRTSEDTDARARSRSSNRRAK